jgi:integrase
MPKLVHRTPAYRKYRRGRRDYAVVTIGGRDVHLGRYNSAESRVKDHALISEWEANGRRMRPAVPAVGETVSCEYIALHYLDQATRYYAKIGDGVPLGIETSKTAVAFLRKYHAGTKAVDFDAVALERLMECMVRDGYIRPGIGKRFDYSRNYVNRTAVAIRKVFRWAAKCKLVPTSAYEHLKTADCLRRGYTEARELPPIAPVDDATIDATLPHLSTVVADMVRFQRLTGARPGEVCIVRPCDVDVSSDVWAYVPERHKTQHHGIERVIFIGPKAQDVLRPYLLRDKSGYCFVPSESERKRR